MEPLVCVDRSDIRPGKAVGLEAAARQLVEHVATKSHALSYGIYFSADRSTMTVVHVHPDSGSLEQLMTLIAPVLVPFRDLLQLRSIDVYGSPSDAVLAQLRDRVAVPVADERGVSAARALDTAEAEFAAAGIRIERVLTDNGASYRSHQFGAAVTALGAPSVSLFGWYPERYMGLSASSRPC